MWSLFSWMRDVLAENVWFWWPSTNSQSNTILLLGLDDAGKTTLTGRLTQNRLIQSFPTAKPTTNEIVIGKTRLSISDVGGHQQARRLWRDYMFASTRLVFMVDVSNRQRLFEAREELTKILEDDEIKAMPLLILGNKIDNIQTACSEMELIQYLGLEKYLYVDSPRIKLSMCSIARNEGFTEGLRWLIKQSIQTDN